MRSSWVLAFSALATSSVGGDLSALEATVVGEARAAAGRSVPGGLHCARPLAGTFAEHASTALADLSASRDALMKKVSYEEWQAFSEAARTGTPHGPSAPILEWLSAARPLSTTIRGALCAKRATPPGHFTLFGMWESGVEPSDWIDLGDALVVGVHDAWLLPEPHRQAALSRACVDALAAARLAAPHALLGRMVAVSFVRKALPACEAAINGASQADLAHLSSLIRELTVPHPFAETMRDERVFGQLGFFAAAYSEAAQQQLPPEAMKFLGWGDRAELFGQERPFAATARRFLFGGWARRRHFEQMQEIIDALSLPYDEAVAKMDALNEEVPLAWSLMGVQEGTGSPGFGAYLRRDRENVAVIEMLLTGIALRSEHLKTGAWPSSLPTHLRSPRDGGAAAVTFGVAEGTPVLTVLPPAIAGTPTQRLQLR